MFFRANFPDGFMKAEVDGPHISVDADETTITINAMATIPTTFMRVVGIRELTVRADTVVKRTDRGMELVLVMDNTGSMRSNDRMSKMKAAATDLVNFLYGNRETAPSLWVGLVPYAAFVNPGPTNTTWSQPHVPVSFNVVSMTRSTVVHSDSDEPATALICVDVDPATPFTGLLRNGYIIDVAGASDAKYNGRFMMRAGTGNSAPAVSSGAGVQSPGCPITTSNQNTRFWYLISPTANWYDLKPVQSMPASPATRAVSTVPITISRPAPVYHDNATWKGCVEARPSPYEEAEAEALPSTQMFTRSYWPSTNRMKFYDGNKRVMRPSASSSRSRPGDNNWGLPRHPLDMSGAVVETVAADNDAHGPNIGCPPPILPLQPNKSTALAAISNMNTWSRGGTMANLGLAWGWRVLSPLWRETWPAPKPAHLPLDYGTPFIDKVVILLTDGENQWYDWPDHPPGCANNMNPCGLPGDADYTAYGRLVEERLGAGINTNGEAQPELNSRMLALCDAMRAPPYNIIIYTIVVETPSPAINELYKSCASKPEYYFPTPNANDLGTVFKQIAEQLANLRIAQ